MTRRELIMTPIWASLLPCMAAPAEPQVRKVTVDAGRVTSTIRNLQGVNLGPLSTRVGGADLSTQYRDLGVSLVRTHDFTGPTDINMIRRGKVVAGTIFPDWDADPEKSESYAFGPSDRIIRGIIDVGAEVYYRLGRSFSADPTVPADFDRFANICRHVAMHYNDGWGNGYHYNIRYWELWNEPNIAPDWTPGDFFPIPWGAPAVKFFQLYDKVAHALKDLDPSLRVGGCGMAEGQRESVFREGFIEYCADHSIPLDFFSWHHYAGDSSDPYDLVRVARVVRDILDTNGFQSAENHCSEWNLRADPLTTGPQNESSMEAAAFVGSALIYAQDALDVSAFYAGSTGGLGLFERDGGYRKRAYAFKSNGLMLKTPQRVAVTGADTYGFAVLAGRSANNTTVQVLIVNYEIQQPQAPPKQTAAPGSHPIARRKGIRYDSNRAYDLTVSNLPWGQREFTVKRYRTTDKEDLNLVDETSGQGGTFAVSHPLSPPAIELIVLERK
jgi:xylan 1,4-beta-xylosidase